jgi:hypothetical protein
VNDGRFFRAKRQVQLKVLIDRFQFLVAAVPLDLPIAVPDAAEGFARGGDARAGSIGAFRVIKVPSIQIAQSEMREVEIPHVPGGVPDGIATNGLPEESQFESEPPAISRFQISAEIRTGIPVRPCGIALHEAVGEAARR